MNSTEQPTDEAAAPSPFLPIARAFAVVLAISIVSYLVWDAQRSAQPEQVPAQGPAAGDADAGAQEPAKKKPTVDDVLMSSSKSDVLMPSSKFAPVDFFTSGEENSVTKPAEGDGVLLSGSKSGMLPSSKVIVLPSSKSGRPLNADDPEVKKLLEAIKKKQDEEAKKKAKAKTQSGGAPK